MAEKKFALTKLERLQKNQKLALEKIFTELEENFLTRDKIKSRFLERRENYDDTDIVNRLDLIDAIRENFKTALQYKKCRRATRYLSMLNVLCEKFLR